MKLSKTALFALGISAMSTISAFAGWEQQDNGNWKYKDDATGQYFTDGWQWIDADGDGIAYCYYFDVEGRLLTNMKTPDGYLVNETGEWTYSGGIQKKNLLKQKQNTVSAQEEEKPLEERQAEFTATWSEYIAKLSGYLQADKHIELLDEMGKTDYYMMLQQLPQDCYVHMLNDTTGIQIKRDYLYYGDLVNGLAEGNGTMYRIGNSSKNGMKYGYFKGEWKNDAPNGRGEEHFYLIKGARVHNTGMYVNWYQDGDIEHITINEKGTRFTYHYKVVDKLPVVIDTRIEGNGKRCTVVAFPEEGGGGYLTFYDSAQTVLWLDIQDGNRKNLSGHWVYSNRR